ncbi:MAG: hypothetical protein ABSF98_00150 [Bryobacteraceae bacterium]
MVGPAGPADADSRIVSTLLHNTAGSLLVLQRHAAAAERSGYRALKQLLALRKLEAHAARHRAQQNEANSRATHGKHDPPEPPAQPGFPPFIPLTPSSPTPPTALP